MTLLAMGVNHHTAPLDVLERLAATDAQDLVATVSASPHVAEALVLSTCNRVEVYAEVDRFHAAVAELTDLLAKTGGMSVGELTSQCFVHYDERAVQHLFEVTAGMDSMVVGEPQISGQVRLALAQAQELGTAGRELNEITQAALRVGKRVRTDTGLDSAGANVVSVAYRDAFARLAGLGGPAPDGARLLVVGAGSLSGLAMAHAERLGVPDLTVISRTEATARRLAESYGATGDGMAALPDLLAGSDVVVCCTGAVGTIIDYDTVTAAMARRPQRPLVLVDLAMPHDTDPRTEEIPGVARIDLAVLAERPDTQTDHAAVGAAGQLLAEELRGYFAGRAARAVEPVLVSLRARASEVVEAELRRLRERVPGLTAAEWGTIEQALRRTVNTLMHTPTVRIKELAQDPDGQRYADALSSLFDLSPELIQTVVLPDDRGVTT